jgi:hypothetical protein
MINKKIKQRPSVLKGEAKFELDQKTKKVFADFIIKAKKHKADPDKYSQTIICGSEEFSETEKNKKKTSK